MVVKGKFRKIVPLIILALGLVIFFWPLLATDKTYSVGGLIRADYMTFMYPVRVAYRESLLTGKLPWWESRIGDGYPLLAEGQLGAFYPPNLLFYRFLPVNTALNWLLLVHILIAATGMYFLILHLTSSEAAGVFGGFAFSLCGFLVIQFGETNLLYTSAIFPWTFLVFVKLLASYQRRLLVALAFLFALQILAGYVALAYYGWVALGVFSVFFSGFNLKRQFVNAVYLLLAVILGLAISAIQLVPTLELSLSTDRSKGIEFTEETTFAYPAKAWLTFLQRPSDLTPKLSWSGKSEPVAHIENPYAYYSYIGLLPIIFLPVGIFLALKKKPYLPLLLSLVWAFLMTLGDKTPVFGLFWNLVPGMKYFRHSIRFLLFAEFFLVIIGSLGLAIVAKKSRWAAIFAWLLTGILFIDLLKVQGAFLVLQDNQFWTKKPEVLAVLSLKPQQERVGGFTLDLLDLSLSHDWPIQEKLKNFLSPNFNLLFNISANRLHTPLPIGRQWEIVNAGLKAESLLFTLYKNSGGDMENAALGLTGNPFKLEGLQAVKYLISPVHLVNPYLTEVWSFSLPHPVNEDLEGNDIAHERILDLMIPIKTVYIYELTNHLPRAFIVPKVLTVKDSANIISTLKDASFKPEEDVIIEEDAGDFQGSKGQAEILNDANELVLISANSQKGGWLYLADSYYPGWKAYVDGQETKIYRANYAFRAIQLGPGTHQVEFRYDPWTRKVGLAISAAAVLLIASVALIRKVKVRR